MKKQNHCYLGYESPELLYLSYEGEGLLCQSFGTNEGVEFEDWN